jgi:hypothetical protein
MGSENNSSETSGEEKWYSKAPWGKIILYLVLGLMIIGAIKAVNSLLNGNGPIAKGAGAILGAGANLINTVVNGCKNQPDCSKENGNTKENCTDLTNCSYALVDDPAPAPAPAPAQKKVYKDSSTQKATCFPGNGVKPGNKISSVGCALGIGLIISLFAFLFSAPLKWLGTTLYNKATRKTAEIEAETTGKPVSEVIADIVDKTKEKSDLLESLTKDQNFSPEQLEHLGKTLTAEYMKKRTKKTAETASGADAQAKAKADAEVNAARAIEVAEQATEKLKKDGVPDADADAAVEQAQNVARSE